MDSHLSPDEKDFGMKNKLSTILLIALLASPLLASAGSLDVMEDEYLNVDDGAEALVLNEDSLENTKPSDLNQWGSDWGNKVPFKGNVPHGVAAYGVDVASYFPKF